MGSIVSTGTTSSKFLLGIHCQYLVQSQLRRSGRQLIVERRVFALFEGHNIVAWDGVLNPAIGALAWTGCFGDRLRAVVGVAAVAKNAHGAFGLSESIPGMSQVGSSGEYMVIVATE